MTINVPCKIPYTTDPVVRAATKGIALTQIDGMANKVAIGPTQVIPIAQIDQSNIISLTGAGTVFASIVPLDLSGNPAAVPFYGPANIGLPPVTGFSLVPGEAKWS